MLISSVRSDHLGLGLFSAFTGVIYYCMAISLLTHINTHPRTTTYTHAHTCGIHTLQATIIQMWTNLVLCKCELLAQLHITTAFLLKYCVIDVLSITKPYYCENQLDLQYASVGSESSEMSFLHNGFLSIIGFLKSSSVCACSIIFLLAS